jgi:hypothetical protein
MLRRLSSMKKPAVSSAHAFMDVRGLMDSLMHSIKAGSHIEAGSWLLAGFESDLVLALHRHLDKVVLALPEELQRGMRARTVIQPNESTGLVFQAFPSHYQDQGAGFARALVDLCRVMTNNTKQIFLDRDNLSNLNLMPSFVRRSKFFLVLLSPHPEDKANTKAKYGPFARPACIVEMVTAYQSNREVVSVSIAESGKLPTVIPKSLDEVLGLLDDTQWSFVLSMTGGSKDEAVNAVLHIAKLCGMNKHDVNVNSPDSETQMKRVLKAVGVDDVSSMNPVVNTDAPCKAVLVSAPDVKDIAQIVLRRTVEEFPNSVELKAADSLDECRNASFAVVRACACVCVCFIKRLTGKTDSPQQ